MTFSWIELHAELNYQQCANAAVNDLCTHKERHSAAAQTVTPTEKKERHRNISPPGDSQWHLLHGMLFNMLMCLPVRMMKGEGGGGDVR